MIRMANNQVFSRRRAVVAGLAASALLAVPALAHAAPRDPERGGQPAVRATGSGGADEPQVKPAKVKLPAPTGRYEVGTTELHLIDHRRTDPTAPGRKRELMVGIWYPAGDDDEGPVAKYMPAKTADAVQAPWVWAGLPEGTFDYANSRTHGRIGVAVESGKHPVVLFSPAYGFSRLLNTAQAEDLASRGYLVVTIDHTHEGPVTFPGGRFVPGLEDEPDVPAYQAAIATRTADVRFVLDQLTLLSYGLNPDAERRALPFGLRTALDLHKVGMFGFAAGGFTTAEAMLADRRIEAGADLDGMLQYTFDDGPLGKVARQGLDRPFLLFGSDTSQRSDPKSAYYDKSWAAFWKAQQGWKLNLQLPGALNQSFSDFQVVYPQLLPKIFGDSSIVDDSIELRVGTIDPDRSVAAQRAYLAAFFDQFLVHRPQRLLRKESPDYPEVRFAR
ncbi:platelet-activating factor acetylhydrolase isoform II [Kribbella voronezhensis]|uniref:Platelet-activating factor acetylhydrolase isoform II n=2 Tax=Kribbella voronezhensis TaxID=2512212 RepID=A0A4R7TD72_9ACTN|nr:platelet-activating factor acetylhydrolase isoform II [Kribbella voronezhensis]